MAVRGIDSLRSPLLGPSLGLAPAGPTQALFKNAPGVFVGAAPLTACAVCPTGVASCRTPVGGSHPPGGCHMRKKPVLAYELFLKYGGERGIDSLRSPLRGSPLAGSRSVQLALPVVEPRSGVLIPPVGATCEKKPVLAYELFLKYGGEGGSTRFARPCGAARSQARGLSNWLRQLSNPGRGSHPPGGCHMRKKPVLAYRLSSRIWR